jgi:hypothetical protein
VRRAARSRQRDQNDQAMTIAWYAEYIRIRTQNANGRMPELQKLLERDKKPRRRQTPHEQRAVLYLLSERYGIPLKVKSA